MKKLLLSFVVIFVFCACGSGERNEWDTSLSGEVGFEFLDSVVVESLLELYVADKDENSDRLLLNEREMNELFVTDMKGGVISRFKVQGEAPDQVLSPLEVAFWEDGLVIKEMSGEMKFSFFNRDFKKTGQSPALANGLTFLTFFNSGRSFSKVEKDGKTLIVGRENNMLDERLLTPQQENWAFYEKAKTGYIYVEGSEDLFPLNLYPETWKPRMEKEWVGIASPLVQVSKTDQVVAVLPSFGNQLFFYELNGTSLSPLAEIPLFHPARNEKIQFDVQNDDGILYPFFRRLSGGGDYFLIEFNTAFPRDLYNSFRAKGENFNADPEYWEALEKHYRPKYILTDTKGNQAAISELPVPGVIHFIDADDVIYIKPTSETELDYNVFYRYRVFLK